MFFMKTTIALILYSDPDSFFRTCTAFWYGFAMHTDILTEKFIFKKTPAAWHPYIKLARMDRPIGVWLLLFPCWWSLVLAHGNLAAMGFYGWWLMLLFGAGAILMRSAGCIINDLWDRKLDAQVERTQTRPLPAGELSVMQALKFLAALLGISFLILLTLPKLCIWLGIFSPLLVISYPLMKRITWWPQLFLGLTFNWGALMGWAAVHEGIGLGAVFLYIGGIFWTLAYDTIYAHQDKEFDLRMGMKSTALLFADRSLHFIRIFYAAAMGCFLFAKLVSDPKLVTLLLALLPAAHLYWQTRAWNMHDPENCLKIFKSSQIVGWLVLGMIII